MCRCCDERGARRTGNRSKSIRATAPEKSGAGRWAAAAAGQPLACGLARTPASDHRWQKSGPAPGRSIQLAVVLRFVDIATDALAGGPRGDRRAQRLPGARRRHRHQHVPHRLRGPRRRSARPTGGDPRRRPACAALAAFGRGALLGARGNSGVILSEMLRRHRPPDRAGRRRGAQRRGDGRGAARWPPRRATPRSARRSRAPSSRRPGRLRGRPRGRAPRTRGAAPATCSPPPPRPPARPWPARPTSCRCSRDAGVVDAGGAGSA